MPTFKVWSKSGQWQLRYLVGGSSCYRPYFLCQRLSFCWWFWNQCQWLCWYLSNQHLSWRHMSISGISQLLLTQFWQTFKCRFQKNFWLQSFRATLFNLRFFYPKYFGIKIFLDPKCFGPTFFILIFFFYFFGPTLFGPYIFWPNIFWIQHF